MAKRSKPPKTNQVLQRVPSRPDASIEEEIVRANAQRQNVVSAGFVSLYANDIQIQTSPWDVRLILGEIATFPSESTTVVTVKQTGEVRMSPQLAKKLTLILIKQLQNYEQRFGQIPQPD